MKLTNADVNAIITSDSEFINDKGNKYYDEEAFDKAIEYYRIGAAMGDSDAITNLGYCYLYGRSIPANLSMALAYFKIAAKEHNISAIYKLGDIYSKDKWGVKDDEMALYYFKLGMHALLGDNKSEFYYDKQVRQYPSLCYAIARESIPGGMLKTNLDFAYELLMTAKVGYEKFMSEGANMYEDVYNKLVRLLEDEMFNNAKEEFESYYDED